MPDNCYSMVTLNKYSLIPVCCLWVFQSFAQFPQGDKWYQNPLGFEPLKLHTGLGFIIPAAVVGTVLLLTPKDSTLQDRLSMYSEMGVTFGYKYPYSTLVQNSTGVNLMVRKRMSVGTEFSTTVPLDAYNKTVGFAVRPFARFYAWNRPDWKVWLEAGGGLIYFTDYFPKPTPHDDRLGTYWNGTTKYDIGASLHLNDIDVVFGARHLHISNGNTKGAERNPSHDSNGWFVGLSWNLDKRRNDQRK